MWPSIICSTISQLPSGKRLHSKDLLKIPSISWKATSATLLCVRKKLVKCPKMLKWLIHHQFKVDHPGLFQTVVSDVSGISFAFHHDENTRCRLCESGHYQGWSVSLLITEWEIFEVESSLRVVLDRSNVVSIRWVLQDGVRIRQRIQDCSVNNMEIKTMGIQIAVKIYNETNDTGGGLDRLNCMTAHLSFTFDCDMIGLPETGHLSWHGIICEGLRLPVKDLKQSEKKFCDIYMTLENVLCIFSKVFHCIIKQLAWTHWNVSDGTLLSFNRIQGIPSSNPKVCCLTQSAPRLAVKSNLHGLSQSFSGRLRLTESQSATVPPSCGFRFWFS